MQRALDASCMRVSYGRSVQQYMQYMCMQAMPEVFIATPFEHARGIHH